MHPKAASSSASGKQSVSETSRGDKYKATKFKWHSILNEIAKRFKTHLTLTDIESSCMPRNFRGMQNVSSLQMLIRFWGTLFWIQVCET